MANIEMIRKTLEDSEFQRLQTELAEVQVKEMVKQRWFPEETEDLKRQMIARGEWLRTNDAV